MSDSTQNQGRPVRTLPLSLCLGWGLGTLGIAIMFNTTNFLVLRFMVDQLGIAAAIGGLIVGFSKVYDAVMDPVIGGLSDRTKTPWGRRRPFLFVGAIMCGFAMFAVFNVPLLENKTLMAAYMAAMLIIFATGYATFNVPYLSMPAEMTDDYHERSYLMSFRVYAVSIGQSVGGFLGPYLIVKMGAGDKMQGYGGMGLVLGMLTLIACMLCFYATKSARRVERHEGIHVPVWTQFKLAWANRPFMMLMGAKLCQLMGLSVVQATLAFFTMRVLKVPDTVLGLIPVLSTVGILLTTSLWVKFSRRFGKRATFVCSVLLYATVMSTWSLAAEGEPEILIYLRGLCGGFGSSGMLLMGASMLPDTMEYDFRRTGLRREGIFAGIYTTIEKVAFALGVTVLGIFLGSMGYIESRGANVVQPASAITAIYLCVSLVPAFFGVLSCAFLWKYDLSEDKLKQATAQ